MSAPARVRRPRGVVGLAAALAAALALAVTAPATSAAGKAHWDKVVLTVQVADPVAWTGTDVPGALAQWAPALRMRLVTTPEADIVLTVKRPTKAMVGASARKSLDGAVITGCTVALNPSLSGKDNTDILAHELGHCLGLSHRSPGEPSVMFWLGAGEDFSTTVTTGDLDAVRDLYR